MPQDPKPPPVPPPAPSPPSFADDAELLDAGQEEVFSRTEVELGRIEHSCGPGRQAP